MLFTNRHMWHPHLLHSFLFEQSTHYFSFRALVCVALSRVTQEPLVVCLGKVWIHQIHKGQKNENQPQKLNNIQYNMSKCTYNLLMKVTSAPAEHMYRHCCSCCFVRDGRTCTFLSWHLVLTDACLLAVLWNSSKCGPLHM